MSDLKTYGVNLTLDWIDVDVALPPEGKAVDVLCEGMYLGRESGWTAEVHPPKAWRCRREEPR